MIFPIPIGDLIAVLGSVDFVLGSVDSMLQYYSNHINILFQLQYFHRVQNPYFKYL